MDKHFEIMYRDLIYYICSYIIYIYINYLALVVPVPFTHWFVHEHVLWPTESQKFNSTAKALPIKDGKSFVSGYISAGVPPPRVNVVIWSLTAKHHAWDLNIDC